METLRTLYSRQPVLTVFGFLLLALTVAGFILQGYDLRQLDGVNVWVKPTKFLFRLVCSI